MRFATSLSAVCCAALIGTSSEAAIVSAASHRAIAPGDASLAAIVELAGVPSMPVDRRIAQTFEAEVSGNLQSIAVTAGARNGVPTIDAIGLSLSLTTFTNGVPGNVLGTSPIQNVAVVPSGTPFPAPDVLQAVADFTLQGIQLQAGEQYAMVFSATDFGDSFLILGNQFSYADGEMGGNQPTGTFVFTPVADIFFDVTVATIPEPTSLALAAMLGVCGMMKRRSSKAYRFASKL